MVEQVEETQVTACNSWVQVDGVYFLRQGIPGTDGLPGEMGKAGAPVSFLTAFHPQRYKARLKRKYVKTKRWRSVWQGVRGRRGPVGLPGVAGPRVSTGLFKTVCKKCQLVEQSISAPRYFYINSHCACVLSPPAAGSSWRLPRRRPGKFNPEVD